jgi:hypothetical protein
MHKVTPRPGVFQHSIEAGKTKSVKENSTATKVHKALAEHILVHTFYYMDYSN